MNQMQQLMMQAKKMQRELAKAQEALEQKEFTVSKNGMIKVVCKGTKEIVSLDIDKDAIEADNKEMLEETIIMALNEAFAQIDEETDAINSRLSANMPLGF